MCVFQTELSKRTHYCIGMSILSFLKIAVGELTGYCRSFLYLKFSHCHMELMISSFKKAPHVIPFGFRAPHISHRNSMYRPSFSPVEGEQKM